MTSQAAKLGGDLCSTSIRVIYTCVRSQYLTKVIAGHGIGSAVPGSYRRVYN